MFLSRMVRSQLPALGGLAVAAAALLLAAQPAAAQPPGNYPRIPAGAKGYEASRIWQDYWQRRPAQRPTATAARAGGRSVSPRPTTPALSIQVVVTPPAVPAESSPRYAVAPPSAPAESPPRYVAIRGPAGEVRRFALEGGRDVIRARQITVRAGETATIWIGGSARAR